LHVKKRRGCRGETGSFNSSLPSNTSLLGGFLKIPCTKKLEEVLEFDVVSCPSVISLDDFILYFFSHFIHSFSMSGDPDRDYLTLGVAGGRLALFLCRDKNQQFWNAFCVTRYPQIFLFT